MESLKIVLINMITVLMMSAKMATLDLRKIKTFWRKCYDVIIFVNDVFNKILSRDSNYIVDMVTWPRFGNFSISMREVIINLMFIRIWPEEPLFWGVVLVQFNNLRLTLSMNLKFYTCMAKGLKLKARKFWGLIPTFLEVTGEKLVGGSFCPPPAPILNRVNWHFSKWNAAISIS